MKPFSLPVSKYFPIPSVVVMLFPVSLVTLNEGAVLSATRWIVESSLALSAASVARRNTV